MIVAREPRRVEGPVILVGAEAMNHHQHRLRGIAALQIGPDTTVDGYRLAHHPRAFAHYPAHQQHKLFRKDEIKQPERDKRREYKDQEDFHKRRAIVSFLSRKT